MTMGDEDVVMQRESGWRDEQRERGCSDEDWGDDDMDEQRERGWRDEQKEKTW